jgi:hypothetical protein
LHLLPIEEAAKQRVAILGPIAGAGFQYVVAEELPASGMQGKFRPPETADSEAWCRQFEQLVIVAAVVRPGTKSLVPAGSLRSALGCNTGKILPICSGGLRAFLV